MRSLSVLALLLVAGCSGQFQAALPQGEAAVTAVSLAPLATCVGVVQGANTMLGALKTGQPPVLPAGP